MVTELLLRCSQRIRFAFSLLQALVKTLHEGSCCSIISKLGVKDRTQAVIASIRAGM